MEAQIVGPVIAGVVALVIAGLSNFGAEGYKRHRDATSLAAGLAGELKGYVPDFPAMLTMLQQLQVVAARGEPVQFPKISRPTSPVFEANVGKLGALGVELAEQVSFTYSVIEAFRSMMAATIAEGVAPAEQSTALLGAIHTLQKLSKGHEVVAGLHDYAQRKWLWFW